MSNKYLSDLACAYYDISRSYYSRKWVYRRDVGSYDPTPDPVKLVYVDPCDIMVQHTDHIRGSDRGRAYEQIVDDIGSVRAGDWDQSVQPVKEHLNFSSTYNHFTYGTPWEETKYYTYYKELWEKKEPLPQEATYEDEIELQKRLDYIDQLYGRIKEEGYKTQRELLQQNPKHTTYFPHLLRNEISVDIGRNGELILVDSRHRLAIAQALELDSVPVIIVVRHKQWMGKWQKINCATTGYEESEIVDCGEHPDFDELTA